MEKEIKIKCSYTKLIRINEIERHPKNDIIHGNDEKLNKRLAKIIQYQGWRFPILVSSRSNFIIAGHARLESAKILGMDKVPIDLQEFENEDQELAQLISDNALQEWREIDLGVVNTMLPEFDGMTFDIDNLGIENFVIEPMDKFIEKINSGDENSEWAKANIDDFEAAEKQPKLILIFETNEQRQKFVDDYNILITNKQNTLTWTSRI
jgi:hypothetical protein